MTIDQSPASGRRVASANAVRRADKAAKCPHCGTREQWRRIAALWRAAYALRDDQIADIAYAEEIELNGAVLIE